MVRNYELLCLSKALSPLTHMRGVAGNEALVMRAPVVTPQGTLWVPSLSGNAIRHRLIREPGARWLIDRWGLAGKLSWQQLNYLFHGGSLTEGGGRENTRRIADMQRLFPLYRLLGGSLPDQILAGALLAHIGVLVCEENRAALQAVLPDDWALPEQSLRPAEAFVTPYQYTRGDASKTVVDLGPRGDLNGEDDRKSNLMIFSGQSVTRGACFLHGFTLQHSGELEVGALLLSLRLWQSAGGTIGGQSARGHGRLQTWVKLDDLDAAGLVSAYQAHCDTVRDEAVQWLTEAFAKSAEPRAKPGKGKSKPAVAEAVSE